jgi:hypothetical protein
MWKLLLVGSAEPKVHWVTFATFRLKCCEFPHDDPMATRDISLKASKAGMNRVGESAEQVMKTLKRRSDARHERQVAGMKTCVAALPRPRPRDRTY